MDTRLAFLVSALFITRISGESSDETSYYSAHSYPSNHLNFNELFSNGISMLADDPLPTITKDYDLHHKPAPHAEFALLSYTTAATRSPNPPDAATTPPPRFMKPSYLRGDEETTDAPSSTTTSKTTTASTTSSTTTKASNTESSDRVVPLENHQRGVLDLILPASRVKNFRDVFDTFRKLLSYTF